MTGICVAVVVESLDRLLYHSVNSTENIGRCEDMVCWSFVKTLYFIAGV